MPSTESKYPTPVFFFSHGSTMMLGEDSEPAEFWKSVGDEALRRGVKSIVMMGAHWECTGDEIQVAMNPKPEKTPVAYVAPKRYHNFQITPDIAMGKRVLQMLRNAGFNATPNPTFNFIHDTFLILIRMFPMQKTNIPVVLISANARFDPHYHVKVGNGAIPRQLRPADTAWRVRTGVPPGDGRCIHHESGPDVAQGDSEPDEEPEV
ncbi:hypothetical protein G7Y89_g12401 [Cudoniella acicularis]|uniref:Extradiol ring-cleavage dioxygenase class III enzyme subunit B domain-containing protein n=1 Tax=Cudoniella acicularis TaxID=354080 RepID=A0A8H4VZ77_9HELO|nr:hypothetical protein G7Y89_g12401 [Cudoniella acicularis]